jgi:tyrosyl-tRNA synthetase
MYFDLISQCPSLDFVAECRRLIKGGGLYLNNEKIESEAAIVTSAMLLDDKLLLLRTGRRNNFIVQVQ